MKKTHETGQTHKRITDTVSSKTETSTEWHKSHPKSSAFGKKF